MQWKLFANLAEVADSKRVTVDVESGATVQEALEALLAERPALRERVLDDGGELEDHINVLLNGENVFATGEGLETTVGPEDELAMFPPVSGG